MGSREGRSKGKPGDLTSPADRALRRRACLVLCLIVLVGNVAASGRRFLFDAGSAPLRPHPAEIPPSLFAAAENSGSPGAGREENTGNPVGARNGPLTLRQRFLLGARVDINRAGIREISELPGLSGEVARAVVEERRRVGRFEAPEDLLAVRGIKGKRLKKILPFLSEFHNN